MIFIHSENFYSASSRDLLSIISKNVIPRTDIIVRVSVSQYCQLILRYAYVSTNSYSGPNILKCFIGTCKGLAA